MTRPLQPIICKINLQGKDNVIDPNTCALIIGITYLVSSFLSLILKHFIGRRILLLVSQTGMGLSMLALGTGLWYFTSSEHKHYKLAIYF